MSSGGILMQYTYSMTNSQKCKSIWEGEKKIPNNTVNL